MSPDHDSSRPSQPDRADAVDDTPPANRAASAEHEAANEAYRLRGRRLVRGDERPLKDTLQDAPDGDAGAGTDQPPASPAASGASG
jgi:hypothetical protein